MWVRLTRTGYRRCLDLVSLDRAMLDALQRDVLWGNCRNGVDVDAPYVAWKHVHGLLYKRTFGPRGGVRLQSDFVALRRITRELNYIETHPALSGLALLNWHPDLFPVWKIDPDDKGRIYTPMPMPGHKFVILTPEWEHVTGQPKTTRWVEKTSGIGPLAREEVHLALQRHPVR